MAYNPPIGSIYHLYTTYILPSGGLYATYHLLREPETTIDVLTKVDGCPNLCWQKALRQNDAWKIDKKKNTFLNGHLPSFQEMLLVVFRGQGGHAFEHIPLPSMGLVYLPPFGGFLWQM